MRETLKTLISILGLIGVVAAGFVLYDRYSQHAKPNIERFEGKTEDGQRSSREIATLDESSEAFYKFLKRNLGKRIYFDITFELGNGLDGIRIEPMGIPSINQFFEFAFVDDCLHHPVSRQDPFAKGGCNNIRVHIDPVKDVERQVNNVYGGTFQVRGYFLDDFLESHQNEQRFTLKPISAHQVLT